MDDMVTCHRFSDGAEVQVPRSSLVFRPSIYGLLVHDGKMLLIRTDNGRFFFPGGGIELGEKMIDALRREFLEETGLRVVVGQLFCTTESFLLYDPANIAWHCVVLIFSCALADPTDTVFNASDPTDGVPEWVPIASLRKENFCSVAADVVWKYLATLPA